MILLDVNVLVHVHREDADRHEEYTLWLKRELVQPAGVAVSELALSGFLRVVTHPKVFKNPTPLKMALEFAEDFRSREQVHILAPGTAHWALFTDLCAKAEAKGNLIPDAYHAALALETGCEWITLDRGFARFPGLRWKHPLG